MIKLPRKYPQPETEKRVVELRLSPGANKALNGIAVARGYEYGSRATPGLFLSDLVEQIVAETEGDD